MKIATLGSCQAMISSWYIRQLFPDCEAKWICPEIFQSWSSEAVCSDETKHWKSQVHHNIFDTDEGINYLKSADYIIYQKIKPASSVLFNYEKIESYAKPSAKLVSFSFIQYNRDLDDPIQGMIEREEGLSLDIKISKMLLENPNRKHFRFDQKGNHFNSVLFLEILREVCEKLKWNFFNDDMYAKIRDQYYPFGGELDPI